MATKKATNRWQDDAVFVEWLVGMQYLRRSPAGVVVCMSDGVYLYMWEAWQAGFDAGIDEAGPPV